MLPRSRLALAALLLGAGVAHFVRPQFFDDIVPGWMGNARAVTYISGAAELVVGALVAVPRTHRTGALLAAMLFVIVWPANWKQMFDHFPPDDAEGWGTIVRLPLQLPLIWWSLRLAGQLSSAPSATAPSLR